MSSCGQPGGSYLFIWIKAGYRACAQVQNARGVKAQPLPLLVLTCSQVPVYHHREAILDARKHPRKESVQPGAWEGLLKVLSITQQYHRSPHLYNTSLGVNLEAVNRDLCFLLLLVASLECGDALTSELCSWWTLTKLAWQQDQLLLRTCC